MEDENKHPLKAALKQRVKPRVGARYDMSLTKTAPPGRGREQDERGSPTPPSVPPTPVEQHMTSFSGALHSSGKDAKRSKIFVHQATPLMAKPE